MRTLEVRFYGRPQPAHVLFRFALPEIAGPLYVERTGDELVVQLVALLTAQTEERGTGAVSKQPGYLRHGPGAVLPDSMHSVQLEAGD